LFPSFRRSNQKSRENCVAQYQFLLHIFRILPAYCICDPDLTTYPAAESQKDKLCITDLEHSSKVECPCQNICDPRTGEDECPAYCCSQSEFTEVCVCDTESITYLLQICVMDKKCKFDLVNQLNTTCAFLNTSDPRAGKGQCPAYCIKGQVNASSTCDTESSSYPLAQCQKDQLCITDLISQLAANCPCQITGDPRAGKGQCPVYCTSKDQPNKDCACDIESITSPSKCQQEKQCTASSSSQVPQDSCTCIESNQPQGCKCPNDPQLLVGISKERCECRSSGDPRANGICPAY
ncbi:MAG: hypothetical protein EZS28_031523, partial [Streblomastix strix]